jgi:magnesium transporter
MDPDDRAKPARRAAGGGDEADPAEPQARDRRETQAILGYPPESVGRLMTPDYVKIRREWTVGEVLAQVRRYGRDAELINWLYVVDSDGALIDDMAIRPLLLADPETPIEELLDGRFTTLQAMDDREEAVRLMAKHDRSAMPVVDGLGLLVGIVTYDDVADVAEIEATEDIHKLGGLEALDAPYLSTRLGEMLRSGRVAGGAVPGAAADDRGDGVLRRAAREGGDPGAVRAADHLERGEHGDAGREPAGACARAGPRRAGRLGEGDAARGRDGSRAGLAAGRAGAADGGRVPTGWGWRESEHVAGRVRRRDGGGGDRAVGLAGGVAAAAGAEKLGLDPAASSSPLVATIMDVSGLTIYFAVAVVLLSGTLL